MVKVKYILLIMMAISIVIAGVWATGIFFQSEEKKVKKQFRNLSEWVSKEPGENTFTMVHKVKNIGTLFAERCGLKTPVEPLTGQYTPEEISGYATLCRSRFIKIDLIFYDLNVEFPEKELAKVILTARLTGTLTTGEYVDEARELQCVFMKIQKKWLFSDFEVVEVLRK
jgi:hypothetical protein